jgi:hypothetical protein
MFWGEEAKIQTQGGKTMYGSKNRNFDNIRGGISSDDPNALEKLRIKLAELEHFQEFIKKINTIIKKEATTFAPLPQSECGRTGAFGMGKSEPVRRNSLCQPFLPEL